MVHAFQISFQPVGLTGPKGTFLGADCGQGVNVKGDSYKVFTMILRPNTLTGHKDNQPPFMQTAQALGYGEMRKAKWHDDGTPFPSLNFWL